MTCLDSSNSVRVTDRVRMYLIVEFETSSANRMHSITNRIIEPKSRYRNMRLKAKSQPELDVTARVCSALWATNAPKAEKPTLAM